MSEAWQKFRSVWSESGPAWALALAAERLGFPAAQRLWSPKRVDADLLRRQLAAILEAWSMTSENATLCAEHIVYADLRAIDSHGAAMMPFYHRRYESGRLSPNPDIRVVQEDSATALVDGGGGLGHLAGDFAIRVAIAKAQEAGVAAVGVRNSWHFGAAGVYASRAAENGLIAMVTTTTPTPSVIPTGGRDPRLGTNPIAFVAPGQQGKAFALDMATSTVSRGKLLDRWRRGRGIPSLWAIDTNGRPVSNGRRAFEDRRLTPLGASPEGSSHKGYGLALMVEILSGLLTSADGENGEGVGHFLLALDPGRFRADGTFGAALDELLTSLRSSPTIAPDATVQVAGDPERAALDERRRHGIPLSPHVYEDLRHLTKVADTPFLLEED